MTNEQKTEAPERIDIWAQGIVRQLRQLGYLVPYPVMMKAIQANSDLAQPMCAAVKPLEWENVQSDVWSTDTIFGEVTVYYDECYGWLILRDGHDDSWVKYPSGDDGFEEPDHAKSFVETYTTRRITEALDIRTVESVLQGVCYILTSSHEDPKLDYGCDTLRDDEDTYISVEWVKRVFERYTREAK